MNRLISLFRRLRRLLFGYDQEAELRRNGLVAGKGLIIENDVVVDPHHCWHIELGDDVKLGPRSFLLAHDASTKYKFKYTRIGRIKIGNRVFIGAGALILPGTTIGDDVLIGAGSVVSGNVPSGSLAVGNPVKVIGRTEEYYARKKSEFEASPHFGFEYTVNGGVTPEMKKEMNDRMIDGVLYVD
jgi:maltose O-acetyltransferase